MDSITTWTRTTTKSFEDLKKIYPAFEKGGCILEKVDNSWIFHRLKKENYGCYRLDTTADFISPITKYIFSQPIIFKSTDFKIINLFEDQIKSKIQNPKSPEIILLEVAKDYNGKRANLRRSVEEGKENPILLNLQIQILLENRHLPSCLLWVAKKDDAQVFLVGTVHQRLNTQKDEKENRDLGLFKSIARHIPPILMNLDESQDLYVEQNILDENLIAKVSEVFKEEFKKIPPVTPSPIFQSAGLTMAGGMDGLLQIKRFLEHKKIHTLESEEVQIAAMKINLAYVNFHKAIEILLEYNDAFQWGNIKTLESLHAEWPAPIRENWEMRNEKMADQISKLKSGLAAIGGAHCVGEKSVLASLKLLGHTIIPIPLSLDPAQLADYIKNYKA